MRISDWSSDVCSSDLSCRTTQPERRRLRGAMSTMFEPRSPTGTHGGAALDDAKFASQSAERNQPRSSWAERPPRRRYCYRSEEHTSELQSLMRISYAVFCLKKTQKNIRTQIIQEL